MQKQSVAPAVFQWKQLLRPYQVEPFRAIVDSVVHGRGLSFSIEVARQGGKNELSAQLEATLLMRYIDQDLDGVKCAPTFSPQGRISLRRLWSRLQELNLGSLAASMEAGHIIRLGNARIVFLSAEPEANVVGHSAQLLLEVDEAQDVDEEKFDREFRPMASTSNATTVFYGTAWGDSTLLERAKQRHLELERADGIRRHFEYDWQVVAGANAAYGRYVESERQRLGESHPLFLTQYCLKPIGRRGALFAPGQLAQLQGHHARQRSPRPGEHYVAGLDLAGSASDDVGAPGVAPASHHDATVLTIARAIYPETNAIVQEPRLEVVEHYAWQGDPHESLLPRLADLLREVWQVRRLAVDATGLGETIARLLTAALGSHIVRGIKFTAESKSRLGYGLLAATNGGRLKLYAPDSSPEHRQCLRELELARAAFRANRTMNFYVDPAAGHDDYLISLALLVEAGAESAPRVARGRTPGA